MMMGRPSSSSSGGDNNNRSMSRKSKKKELPPLFWYMETGDWEKASDRVRRHPREVKTWASLRTKSMAQEDHNNNSKQHHHSSSTKRLALHHACFKLRGAGSAPPTAKPSDDTFVEVCRFILMLIRLYPEAAGQRESRHGCLPLHLATFASCAPRSESEDEQLPAAAAVAESAPTKPGIIGDRSTSDATTGTTDTNMSAVHAEETYTGGMSDKNLRKSDNIIDPNVSVSMRSNILINSKREEMAVQVINALLDAYPKAIRVDSEGGRLPLHTACAGRATPRVISTLVTAYPSAARHRNKDGFLPLHLAAHWGVSHPSVAVTLLKAYPDATLGRNRWERTPLEEALCMAGENGRPHQAALVRALRKHPSYWSRPSADLFGTEPSLRPLLAGNNTAVDVDESLPSNESSTQDESQRRFYTDSSFMKEESPSNEMGHEIQLPLAPPAVSGLMSRLSPRTLMGKGSAQKKETDDLMLGVGLATLIQNRKWSTVLARVQANPLEAEENLELTTRGGFVASSGMTPLHYACERNPPIEVVRILIEAFPVAVLTRMMPGGCLPLHIACTWYGSAEVVQALLSADQGGAKIKDELGNVALHSACFSGADLQVVEALLAADSKAALARNRQGSRPIDICKRLRHENRRAVMAMLTLKKEEVLAMHRRSRSSGTWSEVAREAEELNQRQGTPGYGFRSSDMDLQEQAMGVEVSYQEDDNKLQEQDKQSQDKHELLWI